MRTMGRTAIDLCMYTYLCKTVEMMLVGGGTKQMVI